MGSDSEIAEILADLPSGPWEGIAYRHMFANFPPDRENTRGARWNPPEVPAIYCSLGYDIVIAEAEYRLSLETVPPKVKRTIYKIRVRLERALDIRSPQTLSRLGLGRSALSQIKHEECSRIGGIVARQHHDGLLVPSARIKGDNLVIFPNSQTKSFLFEVVEATVLDHGLH